MLKEFVRWVLVIFFVVACGGEKNSAQRTVDTFPDLIARKESYLKQVKKVQDKHGWIETKECDALLFTGMLMATGVDVDILAARDMEGKWYRRPDKDCSKFFFRSSLISSSISRDMLIGLMWGAWMNGRVQILRDLYDYGKEHNWKMGDGSPDTVYLTPNFINTLRILIGKDDNIPEVWVDPMKDHQRHVVALNIILRGEAEGNIRDQLALLRKFKNTEPKNALFQYGYHRFTDGNQSRAISLLRDFPDKLPTNKNWCGRWKWERSSKSDNWKPCKTKATHSGGDLAFVVTLLERSLL